MPAFCSLVYGRELLPVWRHSVLCILQSESIKSVLACDGYFRFFNAVTDFDLNASAFATFMLGCGTRMFLIVLSFLAVSSAFENFYLKDVVLASASCL